MHVSGMLEVQVSLSPFPMIVFNGDDNDNDNDDDEDDDDDDGENKLYELTNNIYTDDRQTNKTHIKKIQTCQVVNNMSIGSPKNEQHELSLNTPTLWAGCL